MPSTSPAQRRTMAAAAHDPAFAKKVGIPQKVAKEFNGADQRKASGGSPKSADEHRAKRRRQGATYREIADEHGVSKSTAHRSVMRDGYIPMGSAKK